MKLVEVPITDVIEAEYNPRKLSAKQREHIRLSLETFGFVDPIILNEHPDRKNVIIGGHQRVSVWKEMGNETIFAVYVNLTLEKEKELNIRLNKNTGDFDFSLLLDEFKVDDLVNWGFDPKDLILKDEEDATLNEEPVYPLVPKYNEKYSCFIIFCKSEMDETFVSNVLGTPRKKSYKCEAIAPSKVLSVDEFKERLDYYTELKTSETGDGAVEEMPT